MNEQDFETVEPAELDSVTGGILPQLIAGAAAAGAAWYSGGGINVGIANGNNNRVAVSGGGIGIANGNNNRVMVNGGIGIANGNNNRIEMGNPSPTTIDNNSPINQ
ncbi:MAG TPA: hypothetical protein VFV99_18385 [Kofleriaceae bacterium]|nr:hypothetical protein [Kofleriaceae bacterium]